MSIVLDYISVHDTDLTWSQAYIPAPTFIDGHILNSPHDHNNAPHPDWTF